MSRSWYIRVGVAFLVVANALCAALMIDRAVHRYPMDFGPIKLFMIVSFLALCTWLVVRSLAVPAPQGLDKPPEGKDDVF
ncbi:MAG: hypothetical protein JWN86_2987 [Planctomycetota bacterium]|nr:hypothetical protein [Planctomycetota bacterium]